MNATTHRLLTATGLAALAAVPMPSLAQEPAAAAAPNYVAVFSFMVLAVVIVLIVAGATVRTNKTRFETIRMLIESGRDVPPGLLGPHQPPPAPLTVGERAGRAVGWGILWTALGIGVGLTSYLVSDNPRAVAWGLIPLFLGLASFIDSMIIRKAGAGPKEPQTPRLTGAEYLANALRWGLGFTALGVGIGVTNYVLASAGSPAWAWGLIPLSAALAFFVMAAMIWRGIKKQASRRR